MPYETYDYLDFGVPVTAQGDSYDRYVVRMEEMHQSVAIIHQCLEYLGTDSVLHTNDLIKTGVGATLSPSKSEMKSSMESLITHFKNYTEGFILDKRDTYTCVEAPKGELGVYLIGDGTAKAYRCRIRSPGFAHLQALGAMCYGHLIADVVTVIGTQDIVFGEVDR